MKYEIGKLFKIFWKDADGNNVAIAEIILILDSMIDRYAEFSECEKYFISRFFYDVQGKLTCHRRDWVDITFLTISQLHRDV